MLTQLKAKELVLVLQDGFQILSAFPLEPNLIVSLKTELGNLRELVASRGLNAVDGLVKKLDELIEIFPKNIDSDKPVLSSENLQFIFEALRIISAYLETGNPPRGMNIADMVSVLDMLNQEKIAEFQNVASELKQEIKPTEEKPASPLIEQVDTIKEALLQDSTADVGLEQITQSVPAEPTEPTQEPPAPQVESKQDLSQSPQEMPISNSLTERPEVKSENEINLIQEKNETAINKEIEKIDIPPTLENNGQILIEEKIECPADQETSKPISFEPNAETTEPKIEIEDNQPFGLSIKSLPIEKEDKPAEITDDIICKSEPNPVKPETLVNINPEEKVEPVKPSTPITAEKPTKTESEPVPNVISKTEDTTKSSVKDDLGTPCLIVKINNEPYAISYQTVQKVEKFVLSDFKLVKNEIVANIEGENIKMYDIAHALGLEPPEEETEKETFLAAICQTNGKRVGILFDEIIGFEFLKISSFNTIIGKIKGIAGIAAFNNGCQNPDDEPSQPVLVLEIADLF